MKIICIGRNYADHAKELNNPVPERPVVFMKPPSALLVNEKPFYYPDFTKDLHYECEVVLKICKNGKAVQPEFAHTYYNEIALGIDFTARDLQSELKKKGQPWELAKGFDNSAVLGKFLPIEDVRQPDGDIEFFLRKNGDEVQHGHTRDLLFPFDELIVFISRYFKLLQGDLIFTGTPAGVGPVQIGDLLEGFVLTKEGKAEKLLHCEVK
ncbi:MAG: 2-hydroxyhepta-2,4-diene-1,7-dioate isomerase [Saprospirales bacterium]|nr:2-hydroxyhepta-2,4-diene-1,7-dioate isomerase [Saprospirales bacterium]